MTKYESISTNRKVNGKPMSSNQLETIIKIVAVYDTKVTAIGTYLTVTQANELINGLIMSIHNNTLTKRTKPYKWEDLFISFMIKYPEIYNNILDRDL